MKPPPIDSTLCVRYKYSASVCQACAECCPKGAFDLERGVFIDEKSCTACGLCIPACPSDALEGAPDDLAVAIPSLQNKELPVLGCSQNLASNGDARIRCFGGLDTRDLASLALLVGRPVTINAAACRTCPAGSSILPVLKKRLQEAAYAIPPASGLSLALNFSASQLDRNGASRRGFLGLFLGTARAVRPPTIAENLVTRRDRMVAAAQMADPETGAWLLGASSHHPVKLESCDDCCRCVGFCQPRSLFRQRQDGVRVLGIDSKSCTGCGVCVEFCPQEGIEILSGGYVDSLCNLQDQVPVEDRKLR